MPTGCYVRTNEYREKMRQIAIANGYGKWMTGTKRPKEAIEKFVKAHSLEKHWNWKGGISSDKKYRTWSKNKRNRLKRAAVGGHIYAEWETLKAKYNYTCLSCKKSEPEIKLTEDHIIPLSKGGSDYIGNIQPLCLICNIKKNAKIINYTNQ